MLAHSCKKIFSTAVQQIYSCSGDKLHRTRTEAHVQADAVVL